MFFHPLDLDLVDDADEQLAKEINEWEVGKDAQVKVALEDACFSIYIVFLLLNHCILLRMQLFDPILTDAQTAIDSYLVRLIGVDEVAELQADVVKRLEWIDILSYLVFWWFWVAIALEEDKDAAVLLLEALSKQNLVDVNILLLLSYDFETHPFRV